MRSLYEIDSELKYCVQLAMEEAQENEGVISDYLSSRLDNLQQDRETKIGNICRYYKSLAAEADMIKAEEKQLTQRRRVAENTSESLKKYLGMFMQEGETYSDGNCKVAWRKSRKPKILNEKNLSDDYKKVTVKILNKDLRKDLINGIYVDGAELETNNNIQIK